MDAIVIIFLLHLIVVEIIIENIAYFIIGNIFLFPIVFMLKEMKAILIRKLISKKEKILQRCVDDTVYRNRIASYLFFFSDMGPSVSSFSVIALFITTEENVVALTFVFICGIIMKEVFRGFKNKFYEAINKRSS